MADYVLEILDGDRAGEVFPVADRALRIGRKPGNDLVLADEKTSGVHAEVVLEGDRHVLRDLGSTNGTFLDGKRVTELVLTPGDVVTVGRLRVKFRERGAGATADAGDLAVRRLDAGRGKGRGGSVGLLAGVLVLGLGAGGWFWWQGRQAKADDNPAKARQQAPLVVAGNKLAATIAACESDEGWDLRVAGAAFASSGAAHSGVGAFEARRGDAAETTDFAVLRTKDPLPVFAMRTMTLAAHVRTVNGAQVALRCLLAAANEQVPFQFRTGTAMAAHDEWTRVEAVVAVPPGADRLHVEVAALLPSPEASVLVDDVAVTEAGAASPLEQKLADGSQTVLGTGAAIAVRSVDTDNPAILLQVLPDAVPAALQGLQRADLCVLSDLGGTVACTAGERGFTIECSGASSLQFVFPDDAAGGLLLGAVDGSFRSAAADSEFSASSVLLGDRLTRAMLRWEGEQACRGRTGGGRYRLTVPIQRFDLVLSFRGERQQAAELVRQARRASDEGSPGEALDKLRELTTRVPMDTEVLAQGMALRGDLLAAQAKKLQGLQQDLDEATFFTTRGGFERVVFGVDELIQLYGENNLADAKAATALREAARTRLTELDSQDQGQQRARLSLLAKAFRESQQAGLADLVQRYIDTHLSK